MARCIHAVIFQRDARQAQLYFGNVRVAKNNPRDLADNSVQRRVAVAVPVRARSADDSRHVVMFERDARQAQLHFRHSAFSKKDAGYRPGKFVERCVTGIVVF